MSALADSEPWEAPMIARRLTAVREALGMSKSELADALGIDRSSYSKIEKGAKPMLPKDAYRLWQLFGVDLNYVYLGQVRGLPAELSSKVTTHLNRAQL